MASTTENSNQKRPGLNGLMSWMSSIMCASPRCIVSYFIRGLVIILPLAVTLWVIIWLFNLIDGFLSPVLDWGFGHHIPGLGFAIFMVLIILIGFLGMKIGRTMFFQSIENRIIRIPGIGSIYGGTREIINTFKTGNSNNAFLEVVLVEFPRKGIYAIGLVTKENKDENGKKVLSVFVPTAPNPAGGYLQIIPESGVIRTSMSVSDALKMVVSIGRVSKEDFAERLDLSSENKNETDLSAR